MDSSQISRLREEQQKAVAETEEKIAQFEKFKSDYKTLQKKLKTLPEKLSHDVMVPFGKLAFMPGKIVHTNEVLVLLGDNWFAERSAKQAYDIASRRIKELDMRIKDLKDQQGLLEPRLQMTSDLQAQAEGKGDYQEIVEEYDEEKERLWDEQHKESVRRHHENMRKQRNLSKTGESRDDVDKRDETPPMNDGDLWSRLDALEKQEEERGELDRSFEPESDDDKDTMEDAEDSYMQEKISASSGKRVSWVDEEAALRFDKDSTDDSDDDDTDDDDADDESNGVSKPVIKTITFSHSKTPVAQSHEKQVGRTPTITSPADIYKLFSPKPILKKKMKSSDISCSFSVPDSKGDHLPGAILDQTGLGSEVMRSADVAKSIETSRDKAFTGVVKENTSVDSAPPLPPPGATTTQGQPKRVSKFRAQRMGQNPS